MHMFYLSAEWKVFGKVLNLLCNALPHNYQLTLDKLKAVLHLSKETSEQLSKVILSPPSTVVRKINEKIITYLIVWLCYNNSNTTSVKPNTILLKLCDIMDQLIDVTKAPNWLQQVKHGKCGLHKIYCLYFTNDQLNGAFGINLSYICVFVFISNAAIILCSH